MLKKMVFGLSFLSLGVVGVVNAQDITDSNSRAGTNDFDIFLNAGTQGIGYKRDYLVATTLDLCVMYHGDLDVSYNGSCSNSVFII